VQFGNFVYNSALWIALYSNKIDFGIGKTDINQDVTMETDLETKSPLKPNLHSSSHKGQN